MGTEETYLTQQKQTCISKLKIIITQNTVCKKKRKSCGCSYNLRRTKGSNIVYVC